MTVFALVRALAWAIALIGLIDPAIRVSRPAPLPIELRMPDGTLVPPQPDVGSGAPGLRSRLTAGMATAAVINSSAEPRAIVIAGPPIDIPALPSKIPVSVIADAAGDRANLRVTLTGEPGPILPGWAAVVSAEVTGQGMTPGASSRIVLEAAGLEMDRVDHRWGAADERFPVRLAFAPPSPGAFPLTVRAVAVDGERDTADNAVTTRVLEEDRRLHVLVFDPRPSWASAFVRRVLEEDPEFTIVSRVRASRGIEVRSGDVPPVLTSASLERFDLVLVGAPEELDARDVAVLDVFVRRRGGTVVLLPDRAPRGPYLQLVGSHMFDEVLVEKSLAVVAADGTRIQASEFALPRAPVQGVERLGVFQHGGQERAAIVAVPAGGGQVIFSGALDAWRYRGENSEGFTSFWRTLLARAAARAPRRLELALAPGVAGPGDNVRLTATLRPTELSESAGGIAAPAISADVVGADGGRQVVRLWPTAEAGTYEASIEAHAPGTYDVRVRTASGAEADTPLIVSEHRAPRDPLAGAAGLIARGTGGVVVTPADLRPLFDHLRSLPRATGDERVRPMRSPWWVFAFAGLLTTEWAARRRGGLR